VNEPQKGLRSEQIIRLISFNLRGCVNADGINLWPLRRRLALELLRRHRPQLLGFQEAFGLNLSYLLPKLAQQGLELLEQGCPSGARLLRVYNPILCQRAEGALLDSGSFWLNEEPQHWGSAWGARWTRSATWIKVGIVSGPMLLLNLHLDHISAHARMRSLELIFERLSLLGWPTLPTVIMGDFNASPNSPEHRLCLEAGLHDSWCSAGHSEDDRAFSYHGFQGRRFPDETRIDWILHSPHFQVRRAQILKDARPPRYPSDHYPVLADLYRTPVTEKQIDE